MFSWLCALCSVEYRTTYEYDRTLMLSRPKLILLNAGLKLFKRVLYDSKGDGNLQGLAVTDPLNFQFPESLG